jgi:hypothetical protein
MSYAALACFSLSEAPGTDTRKMFNIPRSQRVEFNFPHSPELIPLDRHKGAITVLSFLDS